MKRKIWTFILLMVCALGIWIIFETAPMYVKAKRNGIEQEWKVKELKREIKEIKAGLEAGVSPHFILDGETEEDLDRLQFLVKLDRSPYYRRLDEIIFRLLPIIAFGVGIYLLFLRERKNKEK